MKNAKVVSQFIFSNEQEHLQVFHHTKEAQRLQGEAPLNKKFLNPSHVEYPCCQGWLVVQEQGRRPARRRRRGRRGRWGWRPPSTAGGGSASRWRRGGRGAGAPNRGRVGGARWRRGGERSRRPLYLGLVLGCAGTILMHLVPPTSFVCSIGFIMQG